MDSEGKVFFIESNYILQQVLFPDVSASGNAWVH